MSTAASLGGGGDKRNQTDVIALTAECLLGSKWRETKDPSNQPAHINACLGSRTDYNEILSINTLKKITGS